MTRNALALLLALPIAHSIACSATHGLGSARRNVAATSPEEEVEPVNARDAGIAAADATTTEILAKPLPPDTFPRAITQGGPVVAKPKFQVVTFQNDPLVPQIEDFASKLASSAYFRAAVSEYEVGEASAKPPIRLRESAATRISRDDVRRFVERKVRTLAFGATDPETLYAFFYPAGTVIEDDVLGDSCTSYLGYHEETEVNGVKIGYAIIPRCTAERGGSDLDILTETSSRELFQWAVNPFPRTDPAWSSVDDEHVAWQRHFPGELGDLCAQLGAAPIRPLDFGYVVQPHWSNKSALAGHHPCAPSGEAPYFQAIPQMPETIAFRNDSNRTRPAKALVVAVGETKTIDVKIHADAPMSAPITVEAVDMAQSWGEAPEFEVTLDRTTVKPGDTVKLTVRGVAAATKGKGVVLLSRTSWTAVHFWPALVVNAR